MFDIVPNPTDVKYAYTPFGNSGVLQNLPLWTSRSPLSVKIWSSTKNPGSYPTGRSLTAFIFVSYEV